MNKFPLIFIALYLAFLSLSFASYGEDVDIPKATPMGYGDICISYYLGYIYDPSDQQYRLRSKLNYNQAITKVLSLGLSNEYDAGKLVAAFKYTLVSDPENDIALGYRNIGATLPLFHEIPKEFLVWTHHRDFYEFTLGAEKLSGASDRSGLFMGAEIQIHSGSIFLIADNDQIFGGLRWNMQDSLSFILSQEIPGRSLNSPRKILDMGLSYYENDVVKRYEAQAATKQDRTLINTLDSRLKALEYIGSPSFQKKLFDELKKDRLTEVVISDSKESVLKAALLHLQRGTEFYYQNDFKKSLVEYQIANSLTPKISLIHQGLGSLYYKTNDIEQAISEWKFALQIEPNNDELRHHLNRIKLEYPHYFHEDKKQSTAVPALIPELTSPVIQQPITTTSPSLNSSLIIPIAPISTINGTKQR